MKRYCLVLFALVLAATHAFAQQAPAMKTYTSSSEVQELIAKAKAQPPKPLIIQSILSLAPYRASLEYRSGSPAPAAVHKTDAELMYVVDGAGTLLVGGTLVDEKQSNATNLSGSGIDGGDSVTLAKGDFTIVPQNTPHQIIPDEGSAVVLMTMHVPRTDDAGQ